MQKKNRGKYFKNVLELGFYSNSLFFWKISKFDCQKTYYDALKYTWEPNFEWSLFLIPFEKLFNVNNMA